MEHEMMEALGQILWQAQKDNTAPDEKLYMELLQQLASKI